MASPYSSKIKKQKSSREWMISRAPTLPSDLIVVSFMVFVLRIVLRDEDDTDRETGWESPSEWGCLSAWLLPNERKGSQAPPRGVVE